MQSKHLHSRCKSKKAFRRWFTPALGRASSDNNFASESGSFHERSLLADETHRATVALPRNGHNRAGVIKKFAGLVFLFCATNLAAATYYISPTGSDSNSGSSSAPWATFAHANSVVQPGDTVIVENGTYVQAPNFTASGTSAAPITYRAQNKWGATIAASSSQVASASGNEVSFNGTYTILTGFILTGPSDGSASAGFKIQEGADHVSILGNEINNIGAGSACHEGAGVVSAANYPTISGNFFYNISPPVSAGNCYTMQGVYFTLGNYGTAQNNIFVNMPQACAFQWWSYPSSTPPSHFTVTENTIAHVGTTSNGSGAGFCYNETGTAAATNNLMNNNIMMDVGDAPFLVAYGWGTGDQFENNLIYNSAANQWNNASGNPTSPPSTYINTIASNPQFVDYTGDQTGNYHLTASSPAIGAATSSGAPSTDFDGNPRPSPDGLYDIGAYEYVTAAPNPPTSLTAVVH